MSSIDKINRILAQRGMTGADLSRMIGASRGAYSNWNTGKSNISKISLYKIAEALGVPVNELLDDSVDEAQEVKDTPVPTDMNDMLNYIRDNPGMRILFSKAKNATPEQLLAIAQMIDTFRNNS